MDILTVIGILLGLGAIIGGQILEGGHLSSIVQLTAAVIVFGGTIGATLVQYPFSTVTTALKLARRALINRDNSPHTTIEEIIDYARLSRKEGILSLEPRIKGIEDDFLKRGLQLVVDGRDENEIRDILEIDMNQEEERKLLAARVFESAGGYAPTIGILGAVLGLIQVMENLAEPSRLGQGIAVAFVATVYGVGSANLFWLPLAGKLKVRIREETTKKELIIEGITSIVRGDNPLIIEERLKGFIAKKERKGMGG